MRKNLIESFGKQTPLQNLGNIPERMRHLWLPQEGLRLILIPTTDFQGEGGRQGSYQFSKESRAPCSHTIRLDITYQKRRSKL